MPLHHAVVYGCCNQAYQWAEGAASHALVEALESLLEMAKAAGIPEIFSGIPAQQIKSMYVEKDTIIIHLMDIWHARYEHGCMVCYACSVNMVSCGVWCLWFDPWLH